MVIANPASIVYEKIYNASNVITELSYFMSWLVFIIFFIICFPSKILPKKRPLGAISSQAHKYYIDRFESFVFPFNSVDIRFMSFASRWYLFLFSALEFRWNSNMYIFLANSALIRKWQDLRFLRNEQKTREIFMIPSRTPLAIDYWNIYSRRSKCFVGKIRS